MLDDAAIERLNAEARALSDSWREHWRLHYQGQVKALEAVLKVRTSGTKERAERVLGGLEANHVLYVAAKLCRDSLGDEALFAATAELRDALTEFAREPFPWEGWWA